VDEKSPMQRLIVEIDTPIGFESFELRIRQQRKRKATLLVSRCLILQLFRRVGADADDSDPALGKLLCLFREAGELGRAMETTFALVEDQYYRPSLVLS